MGGFVKNTKIFVLITVLLAGGCSTVTMNPEKSGRLVTEPTYEASKKFYIFGLSGEHRINVKEVCDGKEVLQMQSQQTFVDGFLGLITFGIYSPHTVKVWCKNV